MSDRRQQALAELSERTIRERAERLFADMLAAAGLTQGRIGVELLHYLPRDFADAYADLFHRCFELDGGANGRGQRMREEEQTGKAKGAAKTGKRHKKIWVIRDHRAFELKERMDKRLRALAREMRAGEAAKDRPVQRCLNKRCGKFVEEDWNWCPRCGEHLAGQED